MTPSKQDTNSSLVSSYQTLFLSNRPRQDKILTIVSFGGKKVIHKIQISGEPGSNCEYVARKQRSYQLRQSHVLDIFPQAH